jgi:hypothetical protein
MMIHLDPFVEIPGKLVDRNRALAVPVISQAEAANDGDDNIFPLYLKDEKPNHWIWLLNLLNLPPPSPPYSLEALAVANPGSPSFETMDECVTENQRRAAAFGLADWHEWPRCYDEEVLQLQELLFECNSADWDSTYLGASVVSAVSMRELRLRLLGGVLRFALAQKVGRPAWIAASHPAWCFGLTDYYWNDVDFRLPDLFRALLQLAGITSAPGYLITYIHPVFSPLDETFRFQFRGLCAGEKLRLFRQLRDTLMQPRCKALVHAMLHDSADRMSTSVRVISDIRRQITHMMPPVPTVQSRAHTNGVIPAVPEPHFSLYLAWAHLHRGYPMGVTSGTRFSARSPTYSMLRSSPVMSPHGVSFSLIGDGGEEF